MHRLCLGDPQVTQNLRFVGRYPLRLSKGSDEGFINALNCSLITSDIGLQYHAQRGYNIPPRLGFKQSAFTLYDLAARLSLPVLELLRTFTQHAFVLSHLSVQK